MRLPARNISALAAYPSSCATILVPDMPPGDSGTAPERASAGGRAQEYVESVRPKHRPPQGAIDWAAYYSIYAVRACFDFVTGYGPNMTVGKWLNRRAPALLLARAPAACLAVACLVICDAPPAI